MKRAQLPIPGRRSIRQLLARVRGAGSAGARIDVLSRHFLGYPYLSNPLVGSEDIPEVFTVSLDGFDCVTYVETVLALARATGSQDFLDQLRRIRYEEGRIDWLRRNHYMTGWIRNNTRAGAVKTVAAELRAAEKQRTLNVVPGLPPKPTRFLCVPKPLVVKFTDRLKTGDLIFFASTRKNLDVFHCGILIREAERLLLRHASRSRNGVVEQELSDFLRQNRMAGVIVVRPSEARVV